MSLSTTRLRKLAYNRQKYGYKSKRRQMIRAWLAEEKRKPCADCGRCYPPYVMDFDHVRGKKHCKGGIAHMMDRTGLILLAEIEKCDLVCANCHRERTHGKKLAGAKI